MHNIYHRLLFIVIIALIGILGLLGPIEGFKNIVSGTGENTNTLSAPPPTREQNYSAAMNALVSLRDKNTAQTTDLNNLNRLIKALR